jgi:hypothetical protein
MSVVIFDPVAFATAYPEFAGVSSARSTDMFNIAQYSLLDNSNNSPVMDLNYRTQLFFMLVAHMLLIFGTQDAPTLNNAPPGRLSSATEGTVTSAFEYNLPVGSAMAAWFIQTKYGAMYWTATAMFRSARYFANGHSGIGYARAYGAPSIVIPGGV